MTELRVVFYRRRVTRRWSWRLIAANEVNWASPSKGFDSKTNARRSFRDMVAKLGGDPNLIPEVDE